ncbi:hypothetical protein EHS19_05760 [Bifidobacterium jacchi]|uniref:Uncharacterized protein n=1 Tax=Bifidobacterium jacchi TaxID=2490545 RepID=A0A5N5RIF3_9BIFI|nr:hypothetical protein EHS19_05760 [Bifidobacterium jacchi]
MEKTGISSSRGCSNRHTTRCDRSQPVARPQKQHTQHDVIGHTPSRAKPHSHAMEKTGISSSRDCDDSYDNNYDNVITEPTEPSARKSRNKPRARENLAPHHPSAQENLETNPQFEKN